MSQDITTHPLYRPHHGDMTGWRYLEKGDVLNIGDERISSVETDTWGAIPSHLSGYGWITAFSCAYRRRITPKQEEAKRFVTVIIRADAKRVEMLHKLLDGILEIREGNALLQLDNIKANVNAAIDGVKGQD